MMPFRPKNHDDCIRASFGTSPIETFFFLESLQWPLQPNEFSSFWAKTTMIVHTNLIRFSRRWRNFYREKMVKWHGKRLPGTFQTAFTSRAFKSPQRVPKQKFYLTIWGSKDREIGLRSFISHTKVFFALSTKERPKRPKVFAGLQGVPTSLQ